MTAMGILAVRAPPSHQYDVDAGCFSAAARQQEL
jgi:hypothetical protein